MGLVGNLSSGPPPKHPSQRLRTNKVPGLIQLPEGGYTGPIPQWPLDGASYAELERWQRLWRTPQAAMWARAHMEDVVARYVQNCIMLESPTAKLTVAQSYLVSEVRQQEDRLGRNPLALMRLRWEVSENELEEMKQEKASSVRRLRAIDPAAAEG